ncbi:MAG: CDF family Co(II)/Ni(II) efflux transporter DmeF [bacterium]|jgi:cation diffusion facilitator family transporter|nr:CDF family Co(II)/Ni(II) efflux transporter DmeF [bacterium]
MHGPTLARHRHDHLAQPRRTLARRRTAQVLALTLAAMAVEIVAGVLTGSMALLADGWHMATHAAAFGIALFAYRFADRHADNPRFSFGTGKVGVLGGFASAILLAAAAGMMAVESLLRLVAPEPIRFNEAILVAAFGLAVNLVSAWMLSRAAEPEPDHPQEADHAHAHHGHDHDHNLRGAFLHVVADALTSVLAIGALLLGRNLGWIWLDPLAGLAGAALILRWAWSLLRETALILLDGDAGEELREQVRAVLEVDGDTRLADLHVWHLGPKHLSVTVSLVADHPQAPDHYKARLADLPGLAHLVVEVHACDRGDCGGEASAHSNLFNKET